MPAQVTVLEGVAAAPEPAAETPAKPPAGEKAPTGEKPPTGGHEHHGGDHR